MGAPNPRRPSEPQYTPPDSPAGSLYDLSDNDESEYNTITHTSTGRGVKLLHSKSKVYVHPTPSAKDNIAGFIALVQQKPPPTPGDTKNSSSTSFASSASSSSPNVPSSSLLLAWVPEASLGDAYDTYVKVDLSESDGRPKQSYLVPPPPVTSYGGGSGSYAFAVPVSQIYSLLVRPPSLGWWWGSLVINTRSGDSFPALFFHDSECESTIKQGRQRAKQNFDPFGEDGNLFWGGDEVLRWLREFVRVERSTMEPSIYLIDPSSEDERSFVSKATVDNLAGKAGPSNPDAGMDPFTKLFKETKWNIMEKLARVTRFSMQTAQDVLDSPKIPPKVRELLKNPEVKRVQDEFDSARIYLARWAMAIAEQSEREQKKMVWSSKDVMEMEDSAVGEFEILDLEAGRLKLDSEHRKPVTLEEWNKWFDPTSGRLSITVDEVKERIFHGGIEPGAARKEIWPWLLDFFPWDSTADERKAITASKRDEYVRLKGKWWDEIENRLKDDYWRDQRNRIEKDVHRTDRTVPIFAGEDTPHPDPDSPFAESGTNVHLEQMKDMLITYNEYNTTLGYVQGMSDLLAPIYAVLQDDALAFWTFVGFMERMERNFLRDQSGMRAQLVALDHLVQLMDPKLYLHLQKADSTNFFFFFRMLLVWFKREFNWDDVLVLWETLWTNYLSSQFHLFIALAILERHRNVIMEHLHRFDEVLKYINELSTTIDLPSTRVRAESLFRKFQRTIEETDRKNAATSPGPSLMRFRRGDGAKSPGEGGATTGSDAGKGKGKAIESQTPEISEDLRKLLGREIIKVESSSR